MKVIVSLFLFSLVLIGGCTGSAENANDNGENDTQINQEVKDEQAQTNDNQVDDPIEQPNEIIIDDPAAPPEEEIVNDPADPIPNQPTEEPIDGTPQEPPAEEPPEEPADETPTEDPVDEPPVEEPPAEDPPDEPPVEEPGEFTVNRTSMGYSPSTLTISVGDTVIFTNTSNNLNWPASNRHPSHTNYPGSGITKCNSGNIIFDACRELSPGESFSFTFNETGTWGYHDHLQPGKTGTIIVE